MKTKHSAMQQPSVHNVRGMMLDSHSNLVYTPRGVFASPPRGTGGTQ